MTITDFLSRFDPVKPTKTGWLVRCPAHDDHHPSLGILDGEAGRIVLYCWAGCQPEAICAALGLTMTDLFADTDGTAPPRPHPKRSLTIARTRAAFALDLRALEFESKTERILAAAKDCEECSAWTDEDRNLAMTAVSRAYALQEQAARLHGSADFLRRREYELAKS